MTYQQLWCIVMQPTVAVDAQTAEATFAEHFGGQNIAITLEDAREHWGNVLKAVMAGSGWEAAEDRVYSLEGVIGAVDKVLRANHAIHASRALAIEQLITRFKRLLRCDRTHHPCGTGTYAIGEECNCEPCRAWRGHGIVLGADGQEARSDG